MEFNYIEFYFERRNKDTEETGIYVDCCYWLGVMYHYYLKPVILGKMRFLKVTLTEISEDRIENPVDKYAKEGEHIYIYIRYDHGNLLNKPFVEVQKILLDVIHNKILEYAACNNLDGNVFKEAYDSIIENNFLFEKRHLSPVSNGIYTAQMTFKLDFQNTGVFANGIFVEIYKGDQLVNKIKFFDDALFITDKRQSFFKEEMEWIDEENIKVFFCTGKGNWTPHFYWKVNIGGAVEYDNVFKDNAEDLFHLGMEYYKGKMIEQDKTKGYMLIKKAAEIGYYYASEWLHNYDRDSEHPFFIPPMNY